MLGWLWRAFAVGIACAGLAGCSAGSAEQEVAGMVMLDGQPVTEGHIRFAPTDGKTTTAEAFVKDGKYSTKLMAGKYQVEIYAPRVRGKMAKRPAGPGAEADDDVETIPSKYNTRTQLTADVTRGKNEHDFALDSK
jgi:hypothetical protein